MLEDVPVTLRSTLVPPCILQREFAICRLLARAAAPRPRTASRAEMHRQFAWHAIDPPISRDHHPSASLRHRPLALPHCQRARRADGGPHVGPSCPGVMTWQVSSRASTTSDLLIHQSVPWGSGSHAGRAASVDHVILWRAATLARGLWFSDWARASSLPRISKAIAKLSCGRPRFRAASSGYRMDVYSWSRQGMAFCSVGSRMAGC
jgi:hypothetical protein